MQLFYMFNDTTVIPRFWQSFGQAKHRQNQNCQNQIYTVGWPKISNAENSYQPQEFFVLWVKSIPKVEEFSKLNNI